MANELELQIPLVHISDALLQQLSAQATRGEYGEGTAPVPLNSQAVQHTYMKAWFAGFRAAEIFHSIRNGLADQYRKELNHPVLSSDIWKLVDNRIVQILPEIIQKISEKINETKN
jgi:hypothetical protein